MKKMSLSKNKEIIYNHQAGNTLEITAKKVGVSKSTVYKVLKENKVRPQKQSPGRKKKLSLRKEDCITKKFENKDFSFASDAVKWAKENFDIAVSDQTIRRVLKKNGLKSYSRLKKPCLDPTHVTERLKFARNFEKWDYCDWEKVIFSDESKFNLHGSDGGKRVWCRKGSLLDSTNIKSTKKFGGGNIMVWGCLTSEGVGKILKVSNKINSKEYCGVLYDGLIGTLKLHKLKPTDIIFQHDNAPCHTSGETKDWLKINKIPVLPWVSNSPDFNIIEHVWAYLEKRVRERCSSFSNHDELWNIIQDEWYKIPQDYIKKLYFSMCARLNAVIKSKGHITKY